MSGARVGASCCAPLFNALRALGLEVYITRREIHEVSRDPPASGSTRASGDAGSLMLA